MYKKPAKTVVGTGVVEGIFLRRGHQRTIRDYKIKKSKKAKREKSKFRKQVIDEVLGFAPYELRIMDHLEAREKKMKKFCKKRLGNLKRAKRKLKLIQGCHNIIKKKERAYQAQFEEKEGEGEEE